MTSRERIDAVLRGEKPDRVPSGWGGCETAGMHVLVHARLKRMLGLPQIPTRVDTFMFNAVVDGQMLKALGGDLMLIASPSMCAGPLYGPDSDWTEAALFGERIFLTNNQRLVMQEDGVAELYIDGRLHARCPKGSYYFDTPPEDLSQVVALPKPSALSYRRQLNQENLRELEETARALYEETDFSLNCGEAICDLQLMPGGMMTWYDAMLNEPDLAGEFLERATEAGIEDLRAIHQAVGKYASMLSIAHDLGDRRGVTIGPRLFRSLYLPHYRRLFQAWHQITGMRVNLHSCGSIVDILGDLIDAGVDVINPVQTSSRGMEPENLKRLYGDRVVFYGGAYDAVSTPPGLAPEEVYAQVKGNIEVLSKNGGYIFSGVHNTPADTPETHLRAILQAYLDAR